MKYFNYVVRYFCLIFIIPLAIVFFLGMILEDVGTFFQWIAEKVRDKTVPILEKYFPLH